jgi:phosphatidylserine decarboxylase
MTADPRTTPTVPDVSPDSVGRGWRWALAGLARLPQGALSRGFGRLADLPLPRALRGPILGGFARMMGIDLAEAEHPLREYRTLNAFFVRRLRAGLRPQPEDPAAVSSPVDGVVGSFGTVSEGQLLQAKGRHYTAAALLRDPLEAERYEGGSYLTLYLSPRHYHRIHAPVGGELAKAAHLPGALLPVNAPAVAGIADLFPRNERLLCYLDGEAGRCAVVAVGAYNVGRISAAFDPGWNAPPGEGGWVTNRGRVDEVRNYSPPRRVQRGDEIMAFHLGSTVVLLFQPGALTLDPAFVPGAEVRLGQRIGG